MVLTVGSILLMSLNSISNSQSVSAHQRWSKVQVLLLAPTVLKIYIMLVATVFSVANNVNSLHVNYAENWKS